MNIRELSAMATPGPVFVRKSGDGLSSPCLDDSRYVLVPGRVVSRIRGLVAEFKEVEL